MCWHHNPHLKVVNEQKAKEQNLSVNLPRNVLDSFPKANQRETNFYKEQKQRSAFKLDQLVCQGSTFLLKQHLYRDLIRKKSLSANTE